MDDPHRLPDKAARVRDMFAAIAHRYDLNNRVHSLWRDQAWRRAAVRLCAVGPEDVILDVACGTGDLALAFAHRGVRSVLAVDFAEPMLHIGQQKIDDLGWRSRVALAAGDAQRLPLPDASVNVVAIAFGIRNVSDPASAIREFCRVLRPGGRLCILEFGMPANRLLRWLYRFYFRHILPRTATLISGDRTGAYRYLPSSVDTFLTADALARLMAESGLEDVSVRRLTCGVAAACIGCRP